MKSLSNVTQSKVIKSKHLMCSPTIQLLLFFDLKLGTGKSISISWILIKALPTGYNLVGGKLSPAIMHTFVNNHRSLALIFIFWFVLIHHTEGQVH